MILQFCLAKYAANVSSCPLNWPVFKFKVRYAVSQWWASLVCFYDSDKLFKGMELSLELDWPGEWDSPGEVTQKLWRGPRTASSDWCWVFRFLVAEEYDSHETKQRHFGKQTSSLHQQSLKFVRGGKHRHFHECGFLFFSFVAIARE